MARINFFEQTKAFYELIWHSDHYFKPQHISLYMFLLNQNNRASWAKWFKLPMDTGMTGSAIGSKKSYYSALKDLEEWELIQRQKGVNENRSARICLKVLDRGEKIPNPEVTIVTSTTPTSVPQGIPQPIPQGIPQQDLNLYRDKDLRPKDLKTEDEESEKPIATELFEQWWNFYDNKKSKSVAQKKFLALTLENQETCLKVVSQYVASTPDKKYRKYPVTYLNQESWNDEISNGEQKDDSCVFGGIDLSQPMSVKMADKVFGNLC